MEWYKDEHFWAELYPYMFPEKQFTIAEEQVDKILALTRLPKCAVLDLCCGPGRHLIGLAKRGYSVTGVDSTMCLLEKAKERADAAGVNVELVQCDMRDFVRSGAYDLVLNMYTSFGFFDKEDDLKVLRNICESMRPGGVCLMDMIGKEWLAQALQFTTSSDEPDGSVLVQRQKIVDDWSRMEIELILIKNTQARTLRFQHTVYSGRELKELLFQAGFQRVELFGDLDGNKYGPKARRLIATGWKE
jgi:2-polyprenyl-3-methyl-5-hydroxy-6-metoxy-1,4-benzoquinol methylase